MPCEFTVDAWVSTPRSLLLLPHRLGLGRPKSPATQPSTQVPTSTVLHRAAVLQTLRACSSYAILSQPDILREPLHQRLNLLRHALAVHSPTRTASSLASDRVHLSLDAHHLGISISTRLLEMGVIKKKTAVRGTEGGVKYVCDFCSSDITSTVSHCIPAGLLEAVNRIDMYCFLIS